MKNEPLSISYIVRTTFSRTILVNLLFIFIVICPFLISCQLADNQYDEPTPTTANITLPPRIGPTLPSIQTLEMHTKAITPSMFPSPSASATYSIQSLMPKQGIYIVLGNYDENSNSYSLVFIGEDGNASNRLPFKFIPDWMSISSDGRYLAFRAVDNIFPLLLDLSTLSITPLSEDVNCKAPIISPNEPRLALACPDGVRLKALIGDTWETYKTLPIEQIIPEILRNQGTVINFPIWWDRGQKFGFFADFTGIAKNEPINTLHWIPENEINSQNHEITYHDVQLKGQLEPWFPLAINPKNTLMNTVQFGNRSTIVVFDLSTGKMVWKFQPDENNEIRSLVWDPGGNKIAFTLNYGSNVFTIDLNNKNAPQKIYDCRDVGFNTCELIAWIDTRK